LSEQSFVVGDVMKSIDEMYSARKNLDNDDANNNAKNNNETKGKRPKSILIFVDEINRFIPKSNDLRKMDAVSEQIMRTVIAGGRERRFYSQPSNSKVQPIIDYRKIQDCI
jgi:uncharacterized protein